MKTRAYWSTIFGLISAFFFLAHAAQAGSLYVLQTQVKVAPLPEAKLVEIWVPLPAEGPFQRLEGLSISAPMTFRVTTEPEYSNRFVYLRKEGLLPKGAEIRIEAKVWREELHPIP